MLGRVHALLPKTLRQFLHMMSGAFLQQPALISGGQTGVDRGALDAALEKGWPCGGTCPKGRLDEQGRIPERYPLDEAESARWDVRTRINVVRADATLILVRELPLTGGTRLTKQLAEELGKPCLVACAPWDVAVILQWLVSVEPRVLNVAGPRESGAPGIGRAAKSLILKILDQIEETGRADLDAGVEEVRNRSLVR